MLPDYHRENDNGSLRTSENAPSRTFVNKGKTKGRGVT